MVRRWDTPERLQDLLCELVGWDSVTGTAGEARFGGQLAARLREVPGLEVEQGVVDDGRSFVAALHRAEGVADTLVLISHFDTVDTADYGRLGHLACDPLALTRAMSEADAELDPEAAADVAAGGWLFGRGTMDMKAGLALHMALVEQATHEGWPLNLLLLAVPDEEVNSAGMRAAAPALRRLAQEHGLRYVLFLNSEPSFPAHPGDQRHHVYSGSIGKLMPSALCYGRETHAGTPLAGITSSWIASHLTTAMEWNDAFRETVHGETTPLPVTLTQRDLRDGYSTQTPFRTSVLYNVFVMEQSAATMLERFEQVASDAAERCMSAYRAVCEREGIEPIGELRVLRFEALVAEARSTLGDDMVEGLLAGGGSDGDGDPDLRERSMRIADSLLRRCPHLTPAIVLLFAPPYYPPVTSGDDELVRACIGHVREQAAARFGRQVHHTYWFNGISDLSYVSRRSDAQDGQVYGRNTPGFGTAYDIPFADMAALDAPVIIVGPFGKDPHQRTERVDVRSAFHELPVLLAGLVRLVAERSSA